MFKGGYFSTTAVCVVGPLKVAGSNGFGSTWQLRSSLTDHLIKIGQRTWCRRRRAKAAIYKHTGIAAADPSTTAHAHCTLLGHGLMVERHPDTGGDPKHIN